MSSELYQILTKHLSPERPIRSPEDLRGRQSVLADVDRELRHFHPAIFIYGYRGVGKTSLARTAAQQVNSSAFEHVYVACAPDSGMLQILREIGEGLLGALFTLGAFSKISAEVDVDISISPSIKTSFKNKEVSLSEFDNVNAASRVLRDLDSLFPDDETVVVVLDELEELREEDRDKLAFIIKQIGDQEFNLKLVLVGIADNVHELIGAHASMPRYVKEVGLKPLNPQDLIDIVSTAASSVSVSISQGILYRIAIIGNGFPHFAHLMGKSLLIEAIEESSDSITDEIYKRGVYRSVSDSLEELRTSYEAATQRGQDFYLHLVWALAHSDVVDIRIDDWLDIYRSLAAREGWSTPEDKKLRSAIDNFAGESHGKIVVNTAARYGSAEKRYRYKRFRSTLMRGHVRLQAELKGVSLGSSSL